MESHSLIGPALPPMFKKKENDEDSEEETASKNKINIFCYRRNINNNCSHLSVAHYIVFVFFYVIVSGPALPPGYKRAEPSSSDESEPEITRKRAKTAHTRPDKSTRKWVNR